jgi:type II secretory pathway predicted ATPase ExeA
MCRILPDRSANSIKHARLEEMDRVITRAINEHASYTQLTVYGPAGAGKTTIARRITERSLEQEPDRTIVPVVLVQAHSSDIGAYARWDYYGQVLAQLRNHAAVKDRLMHLALSEQRPGRQMRERLDHNMLYADGESKLAQGLVNHQAISYTRS